MSGVAIDAPVLVIGGGPVGLSLAIDLGQRAIGCILLERDPPEDRLIYPRMDNVGIRTMELARRWGLVEAIENAGFPRDLPMSIVYTTSVLGPELDREVRPDKNSQPCPPFSPQKHELCPQNFFDPVMQRAAASYPVNRLLHGHLLTGIEQHSDHVEASVQRLSDGTELVLRAQYLAGCDGAASTVAESLGLSSSEMKVLACSTNIFIRCPALVRETANDRAYRYILMGSEGIWGSMVNIDGRDSWRLQVLGGEDWPTWTDEDIERLVRKAIGGDLPYGLQSVVPWARRESVVERYRSGRCFLVGDSAHQFSPTGGYGMNTGIAEAADLSWKLTACIEGWGGQALLDSYEAERQPVAVVNARQASENLAAMRSIRPEPRLLEAGSDGDVIRAQVGAEIQSVMYREWHSFGIHLGAIYRNSPVIASEPRSAPERDVTRFVQSAEPGARAPHLWLQPGLSTIDLFGRGFVLLELADVSAVNPDRNGLVGAARTRGVPLHYHLVPDIRARALYGARFVLVRPDGYVAWRGEAVPADSMTLIDLVRGASGEVAAAPDLISAERCN